MARQRALLAVIYPLQCEVMRDFGYEGDEGYIRMQCALLEHASDENVMYMNLSGWVERAGQH